MDRWVLNPEKWFHWATRYTSIAMIRRPFTTVYYITLYFEIGLQRSVGHRSTIRFYALQLSIR